LAQFAADATAEIFSKFSLAGKPESVQDAGQIRQQRLGALFLGAPGNRNFHQKCRAWDGLSSVTYSLL
jgi:hypothetical protein